MVQFHLDGVGSVPGAYIDINDISELQQMENLGYKFYMTNQAVDSICSNMTNSGDNAIMHTNITNAYLEMNTNMTNSDNTISQTDHFQSRTLGNELEILNLEGLMEFIGPNNVVQMTIQSMASNVIMSIGWIILGKCIIMQSNSNVKNCVLEKNVLHTWLVIYFILFQFLLIYAKSNNYDM